MDVLSGLALLWLGFGASHVGLSSLRLRPRLVDALGERFFLLGYSLIALAIFVPLASLYATHRHEGPFLWFAVGIPGLREFVFAGLGVSFALIVAGLLHPSPASLGSATSEASGVLRITRHPLFMGFGGVGLFHLLLVPVYLSDLLFLAGLPLFTCLGCAHQDRRKLQEEDERFRRFYSATSFLPFGRPAGCLRGIREDALLLGLGVLLAIGVRYLHPLLLSG
ncbi:MAG: NnrU family protein [Myxococcota bacterium]